MGLVKGQSYERVALSVFRVHSVTLVVYVGLTVGRLSLSVAACRHVTAPFIFDLPYGQEGPVRYPFTVEDGQIFVMGDNREISMDSRSFGVVGTRQNQIDGIIYSSMKEDMISMDGSLQNLCRQGKISKDTALKYATNPEMLGKKL